MRRTGLSVPIFFAETDKKGFSLLSLTFQIEFTKKKITFFLIEEGNIAYNFTQVAYGTISLKLSQAILFTEKAQMKEKRLRSMVQFVI